MDLETCEVLVQSWWRRQKEIDDARKMLHWFFPWLTNGVLLVVMDIWREEIDTTKCPYEEVEKTAYFVHKITTVENLWVVGYHDRGSLNIALARERAGYVGNRNWYVAVGDQVFEKCAADHLKIVEVLAARDAVSLVVQLLAGPVAECHLSSPQTILTLV